MKSSFTLSPNPKNVAFGGLGYRALGFRFFVISIVFGCLAKQKWLIVWGLNGLSLLAIEASMPNAPF